MQDDTASGMPFNLIYCNYLNIQHFIERICGLNNNYWQFFGSLFFFLTGWNIGWGVFT